MPELFVVTAIFNPCEYKSRYRLFREFATRITSYRVKMMVVECAFGKQSFVVTDPSNPLHVQVRSDSVLWIKENLINLGVAHLPPSWKYMAWIDADVDLENRNWIAECVETLRRYGVVQLFDECVLLDRNQAPTVRKLGFVYKLAKGTSPSEQRINTYFTMGMEPQNGGRVEYGHPGFAWAMRRDVFEHVGGLIDFAITGAADTFMAYSFIGRLSRTTIPISNDQYLERLRAWERKAVEALGEDIGYVKGRIRHYWHGEMKDRKYYEREKILCECSFNPNTDLRKNCYGVYQLTNPQSELAQRLRSYFLDRNEDN